MQGILAKNQLLLLRLFYHQPKKSFYMQEIGRILGRKPGVFQRTLNALVGQGLLESRYEANARYFCANPRHPLYNEMKKLVLKIGDIENSLREVITGIHGIDAAFLYGSFAKNKLRADSDIDLLIVGRPELEDRFVKHLPKIEKEFQREINYKWYAREEYRKKRKAGDPFLDEILTDKIIPLKGAPDSVRRNYLSCLANHTGRDTVAEPMQQFGGDWTEVKLDLLKKYLAAYTTALKHQSFTKIYIDAFAGTGYREMNAQEDAPGLFTEQAEAEEAYFFDGSARLALQVVPSFDKYMFIEESPRRLKELRAVSLEFPSLAGKMDFCQGDANIILPRLCRRTDWKTNRAVLFLDPFGMSVDWKTMQSIAQTKAIDVWILFPAGVGVNRLLTVDSKNMPKAWKSRLDRIFGTSDWFRRFYRKQRQGMLFGDEQQTSKVGDSVQSITQFYQERLQTIFPKVASNPRYLCNSKKSPMFLFTFAVGNPSLKAQKLAMKIAENILGKVK